LRPFDVDADLYYKIDAMKADKRLAAELGIDLKKRKDTLLSVRVADDDARKLGVLAQKLGVRGRSTMARIIIEKFIAEHDPDRRGKR
jgi:hypothetical protein